MHPVQRQRAHVSHEELNRLLGRLWRRWQAAFGGDLARASSQGSAGRYMGGVVREGITFMSAGVA
eukprot:7380649-Prymnesium_polylepis.1